MDRLKSTFISAFLTYASGMGVWNLFLFYSMFELIWLVFVVIHFIPVGFIVRLYLVDTPRTSAKLPFMTGSLIARW